MNNYHLGILFLCLITTSLAGQTLSINQIQIERLEGATPYTNLDVNQSDEQFQFLIVTDRTGGHRPGVFEDAIQKVNLLQPEFVLSVGDLIEGYTEDTSILSEEWKEFNSFIDDLEMPFFYVPGNHDLTNKVMEDIYVQQFGRTYYHFIYKNVLFLCLNSEDQLRGAGRGTISRDQFEYIESVLDTTADVRHTLVFMHQPLWIQDDPKYWPQVEELLAERRHTVFAGHYHHYVKRARNNGKYIMLATTGGGSRLRGAQFGEFDHVAWVTMTEEEPIIANLFLEGIWNEDVSTEESENHIASMLGSQLIQIEPIFQSDSIFSEGDFQIKLSNDLDIPLQIEISEGFGWDVWLTLDSHTVALAPNSVELVQAHLATRRGHDHLAKFRPTPLKFMIQSELEGFGQISIPVEYQIMPHLKEYLHASTTTVHVDGKLDDWSEMRGNWQTLTDNKVEYSITYDDTNLYIATKVIDDTLVIDTSQSLHRQDCIGLSLAFDPVQDASRAPIMANLIRATPSTPESPGLTVCRHPIDDARIVCRGDSDGYVLEVGIPLSEIRKAQGGDWNHLRLNWYIDDLDNPEDWQDIERSWWNESWGSESEVLGSGFFFRSTN